MHTALTIQQVAAATGLSEHTLRYYERNGLLAPVSRAANGHRRYGPEDVSRIEFLGKLRSTGMPIRQMQRFTELLSSAPDDVHERRLLLEAHEHEVRRRLEQLSDNLSVIQKKIRHYRELEAAAEVGTDSERRVYSSTLQEQQP
ncbi:MerR family transcriptional regulator [Gloeobacter morelensis]|uniref:MerR family transcriptional regulator n=1 Tax=Gloeobacter morelensis MG652769 TaxID=2781736 RepID=A0ABY3PIQ1_9CYAN|nr:MerR family transcriptional regulator [Gloeobacter morelensis]UFP93553.1 MerR family transcriptional regulator [Gloeobacter morelensis MG652769]